MMMPQRSCRKFWILLLAIIAMGSVQPLVSQQWQLQPEMSFTAFSLGFPLADSALVGYNMLQARSGAYLQLGYGLILQRDYYLIIPERETAVQIFAGYEQLASNSHDTSLQVNRVYLRTRLDQVLVGDRNRVNRYIMLSLLNTSRYVLPQSLITSEDVPAPFFTHQPILQLSFVRGEQPDFWQVLGISARVSAELDSGNTATGDFWGFLGARGDVSLAVPLLRHWLYIDSNMRAGAYLHDFTPDAAYPAWYYPDDHTQAWVWGSADLKSRVLKTNPMVPLGIELGAGVVGNLTADSLQGLDPAAIDPVLRAFVDIAVDSLPIFAFRIRSGITWQVSSQDFGFMFSVW